MNTKLFIGSEQADFNEVFNVMFSIGDIRELGFGNNNKTYTLNLPLTKTNKRLIGFINQPDIKSEITAKVWFYLGDMLIISGKMVIIDHNDTTVKVIVTSDDWIDTLKNSKLTSLDLSAHDHILNHANVEDSWTAAYPFYRYPMINFGALQSGVLTASGVWWPTDFIPMFQVTDLITHILSPYTISSTFLASAYAKDLYILAREVLLPDSFISGKDLLVSVTNDTDNQDSYSLGAGATATRTLTKDPLQLNTETTDEGGDFQTGTDIYTVPETGTYRFIATFNLYCDINPSRITVNSQTVTLRIYQGATVVAEYTNTAASNIIDGATHVIDTKNIHCTAADQIKAYMFLSNDMTSTYGSPQTVTMGCYATTTKLENIWSNSNRYSGLNKNISAEELLPDMSKLDFLAAIRDIFNLRFWFDKMKQVMYIEPWDTFLSSTVIDLNNYVNHEDFPTELIARSYCKKVTLKWRDDTSDGANNEYLKYYTSPGKKEITLTSVYVKDGEQVREHPFSSIVGASSGYDVSTYYGLPSIRNSDYASETGLAYKRAANFNTRIVHWDGATAAFNFYYETETKADYPKISGISFTDIYSDYLQKFYHYIDKGKLFTVKMKVKPGMLTEFLTVVNTATSEAFRPTYKINIKGIDNYFFLQKITSDGNECELELVLKQ
jgi:hypothetical protein